MESKDILRVQMMSKNVGIAAILALFFGGLGLLYVTIIGGVIGALVEIVLFILVIFTGGLGLIVYIPWHLVCAIIAIVMANAHNKRLLNKLDDADRPAEQITAGQQEK